MLINVDSNVFTALIKVHSNVLFPFGNALNMNLEVL